MPLLTPNLGRNGRRFRAIVGAVLLLGAGAAFFWRGWAGWGLLVSAGFVLFEAARGWCVLKACGIRTRF